MTKRVGVVKGYEAIDIKFTDNFWGGLALCNGNTALLDGSSNDYWWYAIGTTEEYASKGMPGPNTVETLTELYAMKDGKWVIVFR